MLPSVCWMPRWLGGAVLAAGIVTSSADVTHGVEPRHAAPSADSLRDPALRTGTLPNGLRYYVRANAYPAHRAELRLVVNAGSFQEDNDQQGFAHFLEHMAFNGTRHFPRHALVDFVENAGMQFGGDLNAYTTYDETVYLLTVPTDDPAPLTQGLTVLEDWASGGMLLDSAEVVAERGVVLGEWRSRLADTATRRVRARADSARFGDSRYLRRTPIGLPRLIEAAQPGPIRRFYQDWYRPDLMAVVVVGDVDAAKVEADIRARFGKIPARRAAARRQRPAEALRVGNKPAVHIIRDRVAPRAELLWTVPPQPAGVEAAERQQLVTALLMQELQDALRRIGERPSRPFIKATVSRGRIVRPLDVVAVEAIASRDSLERGFATALAEIERIARQGIPAATLARRKAALLRQLEGAAADVAARSSRDYAAQYVHHYLTGQGLLLSAEQELALARRLLPALTSSEIAQAARFWREAPERRVLIFQDQFAHVEPPTRERILALFDSVASSPLPPASGPVATATAPEAAERAAEALPLMAQPPKPGRIVSETRHEGAGIVEWTLSNGARVLFKSSPNHRDEMLLRAWSPGGFALVPDSLFMGTGRMVAHLMTEAAGLGDRGHEELLEQLATTGVRDFRVHIGYADEAIELAGSPRELELLFQLLHLQFTAPKLDTVALASWRSYAKYEPRGFSLDNQLDQVFARGEPRLAPVQTHLAELVNLDEAMAVYRNRFGNAGDFTFFLVGAAAADEVKPLVERYLASLPATPEREHVPDPKVRPFQSRVRQVMDVLEVPKAQTLLVFDGEFSAEPAAYLQERERLSTLGVILTRRLRDRLREELSGTYGVMVQERTYPMPGERYRVMLSFDAAPERMFELNTALLGVVDSVRKAGVTPAELAQAGRILRRQLETRLQSNQYWLERMTLFARLGIPLDRIVAPYAEGPVTSEVLRATAERYLPNDVYIYLTAMPRESTSTESKDSTAAPSR